jgi:hypothetical protein
VVELNYNPVSLVLFLSQARQRAEESDRDRDGEHGKLA